ncbi:hypothetical protein B0H13DRAFT_2365903 [Mycena leptocephala]|nr:hypothetical protein B0H13DRAFT_2365903 [Mycena leptocephala]
MPLSQRLKEIVRGKKTSSRPSTPVEPPSALISGACPYSSYWPCPASVCASFQEPFSNHQYTINLARVSARQRPFCCYYQSKTKDTIVDNIALAVDVVQTFQASLNQFLSSSRGSFAVPNYYMKATDEKRDILLARIMDITRDLHATVLRMETTGHVNVLTRLKSDLETYASLLAKASEFIAEYDRLGALHRGLARNQLKGELSTLQQNLDSFGASFRTNRLVDLAIQQNKSVRILDKVEGNVTAKKLEEWLRSPPDMAQKQHDTQSLREKGTGAWFLEGDELIYWQDHPDCYGSRASLVPEEVCSGEASAIVVRLLTAFRPPHVDTVGVSAVVHTLLHGQGLSKDFGNSAAVAFFYFDFETRSATPWNVGFGASSSSFPLGLPIVQGSRRAVQVV